MTADANAFRFKADLDKFADTIGVDIRTVRKKVSFDLFASILKKMPVDTGRARFGWEMTDNSPSGAPPPPPGQYPLAPSVFLQPARFDDPFSVTVISNKVPYIRALEFGHSQQAPNGMVRIAIAEVEAGIGALL